MAASLCPVCMGKGVVPNGFYTAVGVAEYTTTSLTPETCRSCDGKGIVFDPAPQVAMVSPAEFFGLSERGDGAKS